MIFLLDDLVPDDPVVVHHEGLDPVHEGEAVQLTDLVVAEVDGVILVQGRAQVFNHWDFITPGMEGLSTEESSGCWWHTLRLVSKQ